MRLKSPGMEENEQSQSLKKHQHDLYRERDKEELLQNEFSKKEDVPNLLLPSKEDTAGRSERPEQHAFYNFEAPFTMPRKDPETNIFAPPSKSYGKKSTESSIASTQRRSKIDQKDIKRSAKRVPLSEISRVIPSAVRQPNTITSNIVRQEGAATNQKRRNEELQPEQSADDQIQGFQRHKTESVVKKSARNARREAILTLSQELEKINEEDSEEDIAEQLDVPEEVITATSYADESSAALSRYTRCNAICFPRITSLPLFKFT